VRLRRLLLAALLAGAAVPALAREWYDAYQAGLRALARGQAQEAVFLLGEAIAQHPEPGRNLRTYGTNVEPRYFPYLRLAEAYLALGSADGARAALERSAHYGVEPAGERVLLAARTQALLARATATPVPPPPTTSPAPPVQMVGPPTTSPAPPVPVAGPVTASEHVPHPAASPAPSPTPTPTGQPSLAPSRPAPRPSLPPVSVPTSLPEPSPPPATSPKVHPEPDGAKVPGPGQPEVRPAVDWMAAFAGALILAVAVLAFLKLRRSRPHDPTDDPTRDLPRSSGAGPRPATPVEALPARFGEWMLTERLGRGGMATVYRAQRGSDVRALKRPRAAVVEDPQFLERFLREADIGRTLHHPNIVRIHERGEVAGVPFFTMELVAGETLQALLSRSARLPAAEAVRLLLQVIEALDYAHSKGVVHRDLKPSNIMVGSDGTVRVMDFGIARSQRLEGITVTGAFLGTPEYVAPEAVEGRDVGPRSDLYSLGAIFFEMLTGRRPFEADSPFGVLQKHCTEPPPAPRALAPQVPAELETIVLRLLAKAPADRFASAEELLLALRAWLDRAG
jgi:hypothetical protein